MIAEQKKLVSGFKAVADSELKKKRFEEANTPLHATLSLTGEPLFYPYMSELLQEFHKRHMSTFLVHNGTLPEAIEKLKVMPTQFYISVQAPDEETYIKVTRPKIPDAWQRFLKALDLMRQMPTRTVLRLTLVKGLNMVNPEGYASLIKRAMPNYVEVKGFSFVGGAREPQRDLHYEDMPLHSEIKEFANKLAALSGYLVTAEHEESRVVLLCRDEESQKNRIIDFSKL